MLVLDTYYDQYDEYTMMAMFCFVFLMFKPKMTY